MQDKYSGLRNVNRQEGVGCQDKIFVIVVQIYNVVFIYVGGNEYSRGKSRFGC